MMSASSARAASQSSGSTNQLMSVSNQAALETALRLLDRDPLREDAQRLAMRACYRLGQRNAALEQYHLCREIVLEGLGAEPTGETTQLCPAIQDGRFEVTRLPTMPRVGMPVTGPAIGSELVGCEPERPSTGAGLLCLSRRCGPDLHVELEKAPFPPRWSQ